MINKVGSSNDLFIAAIEKGKGKFGSLYMQNRNKILTLSLPGVSILMSYGENPHYVKLPIFSEFMENSAKFMKNSGLTKWTQNLR